MVAASASDAPAALGRPASRLQRHAPLLRGTLSVLAGALLWELLARGVVRNELFMVPLSQVGQEALRIAASGDLLRYVLVSFQEFAVGFVLAAVVGIGLGLAMAVHPPTRDVLDPWVAGLQSTPLVALGPLFVLWFGLGPASKIAVVFLVALFSIVVNTYVGVVSAPPPLIEAARSFGARGWSLYREVLLPSAIPVIVAGLRLGVARALLGVVVGELFASNQGVGYLILQASQTYNTAALFVGVFLFAVAGVLSNRALLALERRIAPWNRSVGQERA
jgi:NitT/TauT family transport system permease protein